MFGAYYYGFPDCEDVKSEIEIACLGRRLDNNDFMHSNPPYSREFVRPITCGPVVVHFDSPPSPAMNLDSLTEARFRVLRQPEDVRAHVSIDPDIQGINQFGTNTFRICWKMDFKGASFITRLDNEGAGSSQNPIDMESDS